MAAQIIKKLKDNLLRCVPKISIERALLITESYQNTERYPMVIRRAKALKYILDNMSVFILPDEFIVGNHAHLPRAAPVFPEYDVDFLEKELDEFEKRPGDAFVISDGDKRELRKILPFWIS